MPSVVTMRGVEGRVQWGYYPAISLPTWELRGTAEGGTVTGTATEIDTFRASQHPLRFVVVNRPGWRWPITTLQIHGETVTFTVGPCEE